MEESIKIRAGIMSWEDYGGVKTVECSVRECDYFPSTDQYSGYRRLYTVRCVWRRKDRPRFEIYTGGWYNKEGVLTPTEITKSIYLRPCKFTIPNPDDRCGEDEIVLVTATSSNRFSFTFYCTASMYRFLRKASRTNFGTAYCSLG